MPSSPFLIIVSKTIVMRDVPIFKRHKLFSKQSREIDIVAFCLIYKIIIEYKSEDLVKTGIEKSVDLKWKRKKREKKKSIGRGGEGIQE